MRQAWCTRRGSELDPQTAARSRVTQAGKIRLIPAVDPLIPDLIRDLVPRVPVSLLEIPACAGMSRHGRWKKPYPTPKWPGVYSLHGSPAHLRMFDYVPMLYWPVLCLEIVKFYIWAWADAETHGVARQMIVGVSYTGRIRVKFIEDAPAENWQVRLRDLSAVVSKLTTSSPFDLIEGPISDAIVARIKLLVRWTQPHSSIEMNAAPPQPILDPG